MAREIIATGNASTEARAIAWLKERGATISSAGGIDLIELPEGARLERGAYQWQYSIQFSDEEGNDEPQFVEVELDIDARETRLLLKDV